MKTFEKDPAAFKDWARDATAFLLPGETIAGAVWTIDGPDGVLTKSDPLLVGNKAAIWLAGGTLDGRYIVTCTITTSAGRIDPKSFILLIRKQ